MTQIEDFSQETQDLVERNINRPFPDAIPILDRWFGGMSKNQLIYFEQYWRDRGRTGVPSSEILMRYRTAPQRPLKKTKHTRQVRKSVVIKNGRRITVWRDARTGRFVRRV